MFRPVRAPFTKRQILICTNQRDPSTGKPSCGMNGSIGMRDRMKAKLKERGLKGQLIVTGTSCLDYCPAQGCTVAIWPDGEFLISDVSPEAEEALIERGLRE